MTTPETTTQTTTENSLGWEWISDPVDAAPRWTTRTRIDWDGTFIAPCPCGREVIWNAHSMRPMGCVCRNRRRR